MDFEHLLKTWDTEFLGFKVGEVKLTSMNLNECNAFKSQLKEFGYRLVYILPVTGESFHTLLNCNFMHIDTKVTYQKQLDIKSFEKANNFISIYKENAWSDDLFQLALTSGNYSRFKKDSHFQEGVFEKLYKTWITRSINHELAEEVLVYKPAAKIEGFITYAEESTAKVVGLMAVAPDKSGKGIGKALLTSVEHAAINDGCDYVCVGTQAENQAANFFYLACGYGVQKKQPIFHLWL